MLRRSLTIPVNPDREVLINFPGDITTDEAEFLGQVWAAFMPKIVVDAATPHQKVVMVEEVNV